MVLKTSIYSGASICSHSLSNTSSKDSHFSLSRPKILVENGCTDRGHLVQTTSKILRCLGKSIKVKQMIISVPVILKLKGFPLLK